MCRQCFWVEVCCADRGWTVIQDGPLKCLSTPQIGGYNLTNTSRYWTYLTAVICGNDKELDDEIPDHEYFLKYGPGYELSVDRRSVKDFNTDADLEGIYGTIKGISDGLN